MWLWMPWEQSDLLSHFFFCVPHLSSLWGTIVREIFAYVTVSYPTMEVVAFWLRGWCMLGVFLLLASTHLDVTVRIIWICVIECMHAQTRPWLILSSERVFESGVKTMLTPRKNPLNLMALVTTEPVMLHHVGDWAQHTALPAELFWLHSITLKTYLKASFLSLVSVVKSTAHCENWDTACALLDLFEAFV